MDNTNSNQTSGTSLNQTPLNQSQSGLEPQSQSTSNPTSPFGQTSSISTNSNVSSVPTDPLDSTSSLGNFQYDSVPPPHPTTEAVSSQTQSVSETVVTTKPSPKFPKVIVTMLLLVVVLGFVGLLAWRYFSGKGTSLLGNSGELVWWGLWEEDATVKPLIDEYQSKNPKVKVTYVKQSQQDYRERLSNALAKGEGPDIFTIHNSWVPMFQSRLDMLPSSIMTAEEYSNIFYPVIVSDLTTQAGIVGIPLGYDALTLYVNDEIFSSVGATAPKTWDDFRTLALSLTSKDETGSVVISGTTMGTVVNTDHWQELMGLMLFQNGVDLKKPSQNVRLASDAFAFYTIFSDKDKIFSEVLPPSTVVFATGKSAMYFGPSWRAFEIQQLNPNLRFHTIPVPQLPKDDPSEPDVTYATYWTMAVSNKSVNKKVGWDFLKFMSTKESLEKLYANASKVRAFGQVYPRIDMADLLKDHPILGSIITLAPQAKSWYLADRTFDGPTGLNTQIADYFADGVNAANGTGVGKGTLDTIEQGVAQVLSSFASK